MCLGTIVFGQSAQAPSIILPGLGSESLGWTGFG